MPYDPNFPPDHQELDGLPFRNQFQGLKALIDALTTRVADLESQIADLQTQLANKAILPTMDAFDQSISDPPTQADVQKLADWGNSLLSELNGTDS